MTPVNETTRTAEWIYDTAAADGALRDVVGGAVDPRIFEDVVEQNAGFPAVVFQLSTPSDVAAHDAQRVMTTDLWIIKGIAQAEKYTADLKTISDRIEALFHRSAGGAAGSDGTVFTSVHAPDGAIRYREIDEGVHYCHLGGLYRIYTQAAAA